MSSLLYSFLVCIFFTLFLSCLAASNSQIAIDNFQGLSFLNESGSSCGTPIECYMKAIQSINKMKAEMKEELEKNKAEMKEELEKNKAEMKEELEKKKVKSISIIPSNFENTLLKINTPFVLSDYSFTLDFPSTVDASAIAHGRTSSGGVYLYIGFDGDDQLSYGTGYTENLNTTLGAQNNIKLEIGTHNVKLYLLSRSEGITVNVWAPRMTLRIFPH